ncbi:MAG: hypothetical protein CMB81_02810 [Flammeovirgaceae bacterium]|nr:hypothetical protein [Flammeovirgaceae bacterium]
MNFLTGLDNIKKSIFLTTSITIIFTSVNTGIINIGPLSFILVLAILFGMYCLSYIAFNFISYSAVQISSISILLYIKNTIYSSIPVYIYLFFIFFIFVLILTTLEKNFKRAFLSLLILGVFSFYFFSSEQIDISHEIDSFNNEEGNLDFNFYSYSVGEDRHREEYKEPDIISYTIDASEVMEEDFNQSKLKWRKNYWGFDKDEIPVNGRLWVPEKEGKYPIISIIHGNHSMQEYSDDGYNYLGEYLSSHGYVFNSVDQNFLNGSWEGDFRGKEMTTRSWHFLENLSYLKKLNSDSLSILFNKIDFNKIIVVGHSRGGEAVNLASRFNKLSTFPDNGNVKLGYNFNIIGIVTIAPTDYRYSRNYKLENINYMSLQGSMDSDEESFFGMRQSNRISNYIDSLINVNILIEGANHSQFNTSWGSDDSGFPSKYLINNKAIIPDWLQRKILKFYLFNFVEYITGNSVSPDKYLTSSNEYKVSEGKSLKVLSQYQFGGRNIINDFEGDDLALGEKSKIEFIDMDFSKLQNLKFRGGRIQENSALKIKSKTDSELIIRTKEKSIVNDIYIDIYNELDSATIEISFINDMDKKIDSTHILLDNNKVDMENYKFNFLTLERFKKINDITLSTYKIDAKEKYFNTIYLVFKKPGTYYIDNISF